MSLHCFGVFDGVFNKTKRGVVYANANSPVGRHVTQKVVAAVQPVVSHGVGVHGRGKGAEVRPAQSDFLAGADEPRRDVVDIRVNLARNGARAHEAGVDYWGLFLFGRGTVVCRRPRLYGHRSVGREMPRIQ